jgi:CubicO group peptidase (beta-lactamase class C family)
MLSASINDESNMPSEARVREVLVPMVAAYGEPGVVVALVTPNETRCLGFGRISSEHATAPDCRTRFDIGSVTKVFTGLVLADMVVRGEVALTDKAQSYLPPTLQLPAWNGQSITLLDLATHTSGLSDLPWTCPIVVANAESWYARKKPSGIQAERSTRSIGSQERCRGSG